MAKIDTLSNSFAVDTTGFTLDASAGTSIGIAHGALEMIGGAGNVNATTTARYDIDESAFYYQVPCVSFSGSGTVDCEITDPEFEGYRVRINASTGELLVSRYAAGGSPTTIHTVTYSPVAHKWIRFREAGGTMFIEAAPDNNGVPGTFSTLVSEATNTTAGFDHTDIVVGFIAVGGGTGAQYVAGFNAAGLPQLVSFVSAGAEGSAANGNVTPGAPSGSVPQDLWLCLVHSSDQVSHSMTSDWTQVFQGNGGGTTSRLSLWSHRYTGIEPSRVVTHTAGQSPIAAITAWRGNSGHRPVVGATGAITGGTDVSMEHATVTPTAEHGVVLAAFGAADDNNVTLLPVWLAAFTEAGPTNNYKTTAGNPDGMVGLFYRDGMAIATGTQTVTQAAADAWASALVAVKSEPVPVIPKGLRLNQAVNRAATY